MAAHTPPHVVGALSKIIPGWKKYFLHHFSSTWLFAATLGAKPKDPESRITIRSHSKLSWPSVRELADGREVTMGTYGPASPAPLILDLGWFLIRDLLYLFIFASSLWGLIFNQNRFGFKMRINIITRRFFAEISGFNRFRPIHSHTKWALESRGDLKIS